MQIPYHLSKTNKKTHSLCKPKQKIITFANIKQMLPIQIKKRFTNPLQMLNTYCIYKPKMILQTLCKSIGLIAPTNHKRIYKLFANAKPLPPLPTKKDLIEASIIHRFY
jgi:hypothetical protein